MYSPEGLLLQGTSVSGKEEWTQNTGDKYLLVVLTRSSTNCHPGWGLS
jgi:hypothetical protein